MSEVRWIKIVTNIFDDEKIRYIETLPSGDEMIVIWFKILCLAGRSNSSGLLMMTDRIAYTDQMLSSIFSKDIKTIQLALSVFQNLEMIEMMDNRIYLLNWEKHQTLEKLEAKKRYDREYQKSKRNEKLLENRTTIVRAEHDNRSLDKELDIDKEEDKDKEKNTLTSFTSLINNFTENLSLREALKDYKDMRVKMSKGFSTNAMKLILNKLSKLSSDDETKIAIVNQSIENTWKGLFLLKNSKELEMRMSSNTQEEVIDTRTEEEKEAYVRDLRARILEKVEVMKQKENK